MSEAGARRKKRPNVFANVIANAEDVVQSSFIASGPSRDTGEASATGTTFAPAPAPAATSATVALPAPAPPAAAEPPDIEPAAAALTVIGEPVVQAPAVEPVRAARVPSPAPDPAPQATAEAVPPRAGATRPEPQRRPAKPVVAAGSGDQVADRAPQALEPPADLTTGPGQPAAEQPDMPRHKAPAARRGNQHWAHQAVLESFASATIDSKTWTLHGFRIMPDVLAVLKARVIVDRRSTGNQKLAISHYLDAALRQAPSEVEQQIAMAQDFLTARMGMVEAGRQSTYRVGPQASALVADMNVGLQEADYGRKGIYVVSASIESFLVAMDAAGELKRPELPGGR